MARLPGFGDLHPLAPQSTTQGALQVISQLMNWLTTLTGMPAVAMSPKAGAHGELCGLLAIRAAKPPLALANSTTSALLDTIAANKRHRRIRWTCCAMLVSIAIAQQRLRKGGRTNAVLDTTVQLEPRTDKVERCGAQWEPCPKLET
jgi:cytosine/adenosine deaminase-related metal-dependent hydrolase